MEIKFSRTNAPLKILDLKDKAIGVIHHTYGYERCSHCGSETRETFITGYGLQIDGRYWGQGRVLRPKGKGGMSGVSMRRLKDIKALAIKVLRND